MIRDLNTHECREEEKEEMMSHNFHNGSRFNIVKG